MTHHKSPSFLFQDHLMHSSVTGLWSLGSSKSSSVPATYLAVRRVRCKMTQPNKEEAVCWNHACYSGYNCSIGHVETPYLGLGTIVSGVFSNRYSWEDQVQEAKCPTQQSEAECFWGSMQEFPKKWWDGWGSSPSAQDWHRMQHRLPNPTHMTTWPALAFLPKRGHINLLSDLEGQSETSLPRHSSTPSDYLGLYLAY